MAEADIGLDIDCVDDLDPSLRVVSGREALAQGIARRLRTKRGSLFYKRSYGFDVRRYLNDVDVPDGVIASGVKTEAEQDERVREATVRVQRIGEALFIGLLLRDAQGPFLLTLRADALTVAILQGP